MNTQMLSLVRKTMACFGALALAASMGACSAGQPDDEELGTEGPAPERMSRQQEPLLAKESLGAAKSASTFIECGLYSGCGTNAHPVGVTCLREWNCNYGNCGADGVNATVCAPNDSGGYIECGLVSESPSCDPGFVRDDSHPDGPFTCSSECIYSEYTDCAGSPAYNATRCVAE